MAHGFGAARMTVLGTTKLRRAQIAATGILLACAATLVASRLLVPYWPALAYVAAFSEAAVIGGLADWYAVVAIFRRPLGLPLPHTAIVVQERDRIADRLGDFIQENFLGDEVIERRLREIDFVETAQSWLRDPVNADHVARRLVDISPILFEAIERSRLDDDMVAALKRQLARVDVGRAASSILRSSFVQKNRHLLLDAALAGVIRMLSSPRTLGELREGMRREMPALLKVVGNDQAIFRKIVLSIANYVEEVRSDPEHALREEFRALMDAVHEDIERSPEAEQAIMRLRDEFLAAGEIERLGRVALETVRNLVVDRSETVLCSLKAGLAETMPRVASLLEVTDEQSARINQTVRATIVEAIGKRRGEVGKFVAAQVKAWDADEMVALVEENIGPDLQYIRINGAVIGGLAGLAIYTISRALGAH